MAPGSSGLGKDTVGKSASGCCWLATGVGAGKPARSNTLSRVSLPTPWRAVCTTARSRGLCGSTIAAVASR